MRLAQQPAEGDVTLKRFRILTFTFTLPCFRKLTFRFSQTYFLCKPNTSYLLY